MEPWGMDGGVEQSQTLMHAILGKDMEIRHQTGGGGMNTQAEGFRVDKRSKTTGFSKDDFDYECSGMTGRIRSGEEEVDKVGLF